MTNRELVERSLVDLQSQVERHCAFLHATFSDCDEKASNGCITLDCEHRRRLCTVLIDAVRVLEDTRKSFKSRQLEALRKQFIRVLEEEMQGG